MADLEFLCIGKSVLLGANSRRGRNWIEQHVDHCHKTGGKTVISLSYFEEVKSAAQADDLTVGIVEPA